ncbi:hypothetical protein VitviT2T_004148 [Vitis vinifera]|uniref:CCHC-type domain-containing protein n=1 Tax=Vitis vinifera TaxID=29760 RepID=A0ABY9BPT3_VITVI|nr:hypothetical protein VitviT2T_004148 [Vitis vinifera]
MSNPIFSLLASEVLTGENFVKWKSNMNILLINENYHFVLKEDCPPVPPANASKAVSEEYNRWVIANNKARCYLLAVMNEVLRTKHEGLETISEIMESLQTNYIMNHKKCNLTELLNELQSYETLIDDKGGKANIVEANAVVGKASSSRNKKKRNVRNQKDKKKIQKKKRKAVAPKPKGKCFHCNQDGHWKRNCKKYLDELKQKKKQDA